MQSIDVIMHLLFLGVVKTVVISLDEWLKLRGKSERFLSCACYLSAVSELQLSWCKVIKFSGGKMAGWVSENYLGLVRILPWFYSELESIEEVTYTAPSKPQKQWTSVENRQWLMAHGIPCRNLRAKELQLLVSTNIIEATIQIVPPAGGTVEQVLDVVLSLFVMTCEVMNHVATPCTIKSLRRKIIVFLSCYDKFDANM